jgi:diacylglycerol kinase (ATP)
VRAIGTDEDAGSDIVVLHHPSAGDEDVVAEEILELLARHGIGPVHYREWDEGALEVVAQDRGLVVVAGGDGTVASALLAARGRRPPVGILPSGTANNIARSIGLDVTDVEAAARVVAQGRVRQIDLPVACAGDTPQRFVESVGVGLFAELLAEGDRRGDLTLEQARRLMAEVVAGLTAWPASIEVDGVVREASVLGVQVMNIDRAGPGVVLAPGADPGSGRVVAVVIDDSHRQALLDAIELHVHDEEDIELALPAWEGAAVGVSSRAPVAVTVDDELLDPTGTITVTCGDGVRATVIAPPRGDGET